MMLDTNNNSKVHLFTKVDEFSQNMSYMTGKMVDGNASVNLSVSTQFSDVDININGTDYTLSPHTQGILIIIYSAITFLALGGNAIVCYIVLAYQRMRTVTNYFIVNLALSDILMAILCIPFSFIANMLFHYWPFGAVMCPIVTYSQTVSVFASAFTLVAISLDRYIAIMHPLRPRMTTKQAFLVIAAIWVLALSVSLPVAVLSRIVLSKENLELCMEVWPEDHQRASFTTAIMVLQYFLPLFILMFTYTRIGVIIWVKQTPGEAESNRDQRMAASKRKMVKMMITVVIIYALCWLPLHTITLVGDKHHEIYDYPFINVVWICCHWLAMSNCCYNPLVYIWMNSKFRNGFRHVLRFCPCIRHESSAKGSLTRNTYATSMRSSIYDRNSVSVAFSKRKCEESETVCEELEATPLNKTSSNGVDQRYPRQITFIKRDGRY